MSTEHVCPSEDLRAREAGREHRNGQAERTAPRPRETESTTRPRHAQNPW